MSIAIDELREWAQAQADTVWTGLPRSEEAYYLQVVDALDLLDEALAAATELSDEVEEALELRKVLGLDPPPPALPRLHLPK